MACFMRNHLEMRFFLSSANRSQIEHCANKLFVAGIRTHVCSGRDGRQAGKDAESDELWLNSERDYEAALTLFGGALPAEPSA